MQNKKKENGLKNIFKTPCYKLIKYQKDMYSKQAKKGMHK